MNRPPGRSTRRASASARALSVTLRRPNAAVYRSKVPSAKGSRSASPWTHASRAAAAGGNRAPARARPTSIMSALMSKTVTAAAAAAADASASASAEAASRPPAGWPGGTAPAASGQHSCSCSRILKAMSPVPPATSRTLGLSPPAAASADRPMFSTKSSFQSRWIPALIASFMRSYFEATFVKTSRTLSLFSPYSTFSKPKSIFEPWGSCVDRQRLFEQHKFLKR
mmetsp:Transcript_14295/g.23341  ORF Transcript_14295/g.23341 Transcript_14295/m.23341 type:complete len:226 (-) Transcript_14295:178-855(-)